MTIPDRVKRFITATNSFCVVVEDGKPGYVVAPFDWAEHVFLGSEEDGDDDVLDDVNTTMSLLSDEDAVSSGISSDAVEGESQSHDA